MTDSKGDLQHKKNPDWIIIIIFVVFPILIMFYFDVTVVFFNNDDFFLGELVSGITTGKPESHLIHIGYPLGFVLSRLYMLWPNISWYGTFLFGISYISIIYAFSVMLLRLEKVWQKYLFMILAWCVLFSFFFFHLAQLQYTTVTVIVVMAALIRFLLNGEEDSTAKFLKENIVGFVFFAISLSIRDKACIMILPFFVLFAVSKVIKNKKMLRPVIGYLLCLLAIIVTVMSVERIAYSSEAWNKTEKYNTARENLVDYVGYPSYKEHVGVYEELGISEQSYVSMSTRYQILLDENVNTDTFVTLREIAKTNQLRDILVSVKYFIERHLKDTLDRPLNIIVYYMYIFAIVMIFLSRKYNVLFDMLAVFCSRMMIWVYLLYIGRIPQRVTQGVYIVELMVLFALIVGNLLWKDTKKEKAKIPMTAGIVVTVAILLICFKWGMPNSQRVYYNNQSQMVFSTSYREMREYFTANSENVYLGDTMSFSYFNKDIFEQEYPSAGNFVIMGSWIANTKWTDSIAERYQIESYEEAAIMQDNVYFVCMDSADTSWQYLADYYAEKYPGSEMEVAEIIETTYGLDFFILKVRQG